MVDAPDTPADDDDDDERDAIDLARRAGPLRTLLATALETDEYVYWER